MYYFCLNIYNAYEMFRTEWIQRVYNITYMYMILACNMLS